MSCAGRVFPGWTGTKDSSVMPASGSGLAQTIRRKDEDLQDVRCRGSLGERTCQETPALPTDPLKPSARAPALPRAAGTRSTDSSHRQLGCFLQGRCMAGSVSLRRAPTVYGTRLGGSKWEQRRSSVRLCPPLLPNGDLTHQHRPEGAGGREQADSGRRGSHRNRGRAQVSATHSGSF